MFEQHSCPVETVHGEKEEGEEEKAVLVPSVGGEGRGGGRGEGRAVQGGGGGVGGEEGGRGEGGGGEDPSPPALQ